MPNFIKKIGLFTKIMIGFALGILAGIVMREDAAMFAFLGTILTKMLTMVVAPLVLCVIVVAVANLKDGKRVGRIGIKSVTIFLISTLGVIALGLVVANLMNIGSGVIIDTAIKAQEVKSVTIIDTIVGLVPANIFAAMSTDQLLQIIFFAILLGFAILKMGAKGEPLLNFFKMAQEAMQKLVGIILEFTPIGVFGLMADVIGKNGLDILLPYTKAIIAVYLCSVIYLFVVQAGIMVGGFGRVSPAKFISAMKEPMLFVFASCSSVATIPLTLRATKKLGVDEDTANFVVPLGAVVNMNGTAIYQAVAVVFTAQIFGIELTFADQAMVMLTATLAAIGTAGIPGSGLIMLTIVLGAANLPMEGVALLAGIDRILNMGRVVPNIVGDAATAVMVSRSEKTFIDNKLIDNKLIDVEV